MELAFWNAHRWLACGASAAPVTSATIPPADVTTEGLAAHWVAERVLFGDACVDDFEGEVSPHGHEIDGAILNAVADYQEHLAPYLKNATGAGTEERLSFDEINGRVDAFIRHDEYVLVVDFKYGFRPVSPVMNWQLILAALALDIGEPWFILAIFQPRAAPSNPWQTVTYSHDQLLHFREYIRARVKQIKDGDREEHVGSHCWRCPHAASCTGLGAELERRVEVKSNDLTWLRQTQELLSSRINAVEADMSERIRRGEFIQGWTLTPRLGRRQFTVDPVSVHALTGVAGSKQVSRSPAELERDGVPRAVLDKITTRNLTTPKLEPWNPEEIRKLFND